MRRLHSLSFIAVSALFSLAACSSDTTDDGNTGGTGTSGTGGSGTSGTAGSGVSGTGGSGTSGAAGSGVGGSGTSGAAGSGTSGAAGSGTSGAGGGGTADHPTDSSQAGIEAFLNAMSFKGSGWRPATMASTGMSVHGTVNRYFNETLIASKAAGHGTPANPHTAGSMVVKEILDGTTVAGHAVLLRTDTGWVYYCTANAEGRCFSGSVASTTSYATTAGSCNCHGSGTIVSTDTIPAP